MRSRPHLVLLGRSDRCQFSQHRLDRVARPRARERGLPEHAGEPLQLQREVRTLRTEVLGGEDRLRQALEHVTTESLRGARTRAAASRACAVVSSPAACS
jgi:hypothetical protein